MDQALTTTTETAVAAPSQALDLFNLTAFKDAYRVAEVLAKSRLIPKEFQGNVTDCIIAMEMAQRIGAGVFAVMQSLYIVHGKPGWSATFIIGALNACGRFAPLRFSITEPEEKTVNGKKFADRVCTAWTIEKGTGERLEGPPVSIEMAHREGWHDKNGSKWQTMPELMLRYRAATFFGRLYAPDILMGMRTAEELHDHPVEAVPEERPLVEDLNARFGGKETIDMKTGEIVPPPESNPQPPKKSAVTPPAQQQQAPPPPAQEKKATEPPPPEAPHPAEQHAPEGQGSVAISDVVKKYMREINRASEGGSVAVDQWRMKHVNRYLKDCGGDQQHPDFLAIRDYAQMVYDECKRAESEAAGQ